MGAPRARTHRLATVSVAAHPQSYGDVPTGSAPRDRREALGQVVRIIVAAPGSALGRYPEGNTGRVSAGLMTPMPVPGDLAAEIAAAA